MPVLWVHTSRTLLLAMTALGAATPVAAQNYSVATRVTAGGGSMATGGPFTLAGTTGQPVAASEPGLAGTYSLVSGFWPTSDATRLVVPFIDSALTPGVSLIRLVHVMELRQRIDSLRARFSLAPYAWTDPVLIPGTTVARAVHFTDLRTALAQAYAAAGIGPPAYAAGVGVGAPITAAGVTELRTAVIALE